MIIKKENGAEIVRMQMDELEDRMHRLGHTSFKLKCPHHLVKEIPNPNGPMYFTVCAICGMEIIE